MVSTDVLREKDNSAHRFSVMSLVEIIPVMEQTLSTSLIRDIAGVTENRAVREWRDLSRRPHPKQEFRLRVGARILGLLHDPEMPWLVGAWMQSPNPLLGDVTPLRLIGNIDHSEQGEDTARDVILAAKQELLAK